MPYNREKFIKDVYAQTYQLSKEEEIPHDFIIAQVIQETGWGKHILEGTHNIFNIKADVSWKGEKSTHKVWEVEHGKKVWVNDDFRKYDSYKESVSDWLNFLHDNPRYKALFEEKNLSTEEFAKRIQDAGYATDPDYAKNIVNITHGRTYKDLVGKAKEAYETESTNDTIKVDESGKAIFRGSNDININEYTEVSKNTNSLMLELPELDTTLKAQEVVSSLDLPQYDNSMDYGINDEIDMA